MKFKYMYIDESGDLGFKRGSSSFIVISALVVDDSRELDRIIKNMRRNKFKKELRKVSEIKAYSLHDFIRVYMLRKLNEVSGAKVFHIILEKKRVSSNFLISNKHKLYNFIAGKLAKNILMDDVNIEIKIDKSKGNILLQKDFNDYFEKLLKENCDEMKCKIEHNYSHSWSGLQFADLLAWCCFQKFEKNNDSYLEELSIEQEFYIIWR